MEHPKLIVSNQKEESISGLGLRSEAVLILHEKLSCTESVKLSFVTFRVVKNRFKHVYLIV